jgi:hypothetical protein
MSVFEGGCFCGKIRYRARGTPLYPTICHCTSCRRTSGAPLVAWASFRTADIEWLAGAPRRLDSSEIAHRTFCGDCGTALTFVYRAEPELTDVTLASLDRPELIEPADHTFSKSLIPWIHLADGLPRFAERRDD